MLSMMSLTIPAAMICKYIYLFYLSSYILAKSKPLVFYRQSPANLRFLPGSCSEAWFSFKGNIIWIKYDNNINYKKIHLSILAGKSIHEGTEYLADYSLECDDD